MVIAILCLLLPGHLTPTIRSMIRIVAILLALVMSTAVAYAHGGGIDGLGYHHNRKAGILSTATLRSVRGLEDTDRRDAQRLRR